LPYRSPRAYPIPAGMKHVRTQLLDDDDLRPLLERGDTIVFLNLGREWEKLERQVERLGYTETYAVSRGSNPNAPGRTASARLSPFHSPRQER
jgi:hypothetical protein